MAFGLTSFITNAVETDEALTGTYLQVSEFVITGTTADVLLDIGVLASGTFWPAVANAAALAAWTQVVQAASALVSWESWELESGFKPAGGAVIGTGLYKQGGTYLAPTFTLNAGEGLLAYTFTFVHRLTRGSRPVRYGMTGV